MLFDRASVRDILSRLATRHRLFIGTTSWRFLGWCGTLYDEDRYLWGNHFSKKRFNEHCIEEYAAVFPSVEVDSTYYSLPRIALLKDLASQVPDSFRLSFKVPDTITIKNFPNLKTFGNRAGKPNEHFLSEPLFKMGFLRHMEEIREKVGMFVFEFSHFYPNDFEHGRDFVDALDRFFQGLPDEWQYGVEIRNRNLFHPDYFAMLESHGVAHVYNHWTSMPPVSEQLTLHAIGESPVVAARFLLTPGRTFSSARKKFEPFNRLQEIDFDAREAMRDLMQAVIADPDKTGYLYVGNDLEGNALHTISDVLETLDGELPF